MNNLFRKPTNNLECLIIHNAMWELDVWYTNAHFKKHTAAEVHMHRRTAQFSPEVESPLFKKNVVDE